MNSNFPQILKELRQEKNLTQARLAQILNYTQSNISEWEKGTVEPKATALSALASYFNVTVDYLIGLEEVGINMPFSNNLSSEEQKLVDNYRELNLSGKHLINETIKTLLTSMDGSIQKKRF